MQFEIDIIRFIQSIRSDFLDSIMNLLTEIGDQFVFIGVAFIIYWLIDKRSAFKLAFVFIFSAIINVFVKDIVKRPRPHHLHPELNVGDPLADYSMPSGHSQNTAVLATVLHKEYNHKFKWLKWVLLAALIIVPITRMYLGQHYLTDTLVGIGLGIGISLIMMKVVDLMGDKEHIYGLMLLVPLIGVFLFTYFGESSYESSKNLYVATGGLTGFLFGYLVDKLYIKHQTQVQGLKTLYRILIGFVLVIGLYLGLSTLFKSIDPENGIFDALRYAIVAFIGTAGTSFIFKLLKV